MLKFIKKKFERNNKQPIEKLNLFQLGTILDTEEPMTIDLSQSNGHTHISGGKDTLAKKATLELARQQIESNGGLILLDAKSDAETRNMIIEVLEKAGRMDDFYHLDLSHVKANKIDESLLYLDAHAGSEEFKELIEKIKEQSPLQELLKIETLGSDATALKKKPNGHKNQANIIPFVNKDTKTTYNPLKNGNALEIAHRICCFTEQYKTYKRPNLNDSLVLKDLHIIIMILKLIDIPFSLDTIKSLVSNSGCKKLLQYLPMARKKNPSDFAVFDLDELIKRYNIRTDNPTIEQTFSELIHNLNTAQFDISTEFNQTHSAIDMRKIIASKKILLVSVSEDMPMEQFIPYLQLIVLDIRSALDFVYSDFDKKVNQPFMLINHEFTEYFDSHWARLYAYTNPSKVHMVITSEKPLELVEPEQSEFGDYKEILRNQTEYRLVFKPVDDQQALLISNYFSETILGTLNSANHVILGNIKFPNVNANKIANFDNDVALLIQKDAVTARLKFK